MTADIVFLNGWAMSESAWHPLLAAAPRHWSTEIINLHALQGRSVEELAAAAARYAPERCDVIGWSLGAEVALQWAHDRPQQVARLILIAATPCFVARPDWPAGMAASVFEEFVADMHRDPADALRRFTLLQARGDANVHGVARVLRDALAPHDEVALDHGLECLKNGDLRALAPHVTQQTRLIHGGRDGLVPLDAAERLRALLPHSKLEVVSNAAHAPHISDPAAVAASISEFLYEQ
ncbi:MAG: alpha/beta fold hydrolase [Rhodospirillaceae bacterium]